MAFVASYKYIQQLTTASDAVSIVAAEFNILVCYQTPINSETPPLFPFSKSSEMLVAKVPKQDVGGLCNLGSVTYMYGSDYNYGDARDASPNSFQGSVFLTTSTLQIGAVWNICQHFDIPA